jgi:hypothetical protein
MSREEFLEMHADCVTAMRSYFVQVEKTSAMLAECTAEPLTFTERFTLTSQGIVENDARLVRIPAKEIAHSDLMSIKIEASFRWTVIC